MRNERSLPADAGVELDEFVVVPLNAEVRHPPDAFAQDPNHRAEELHPAPGGLQISDREAGLLGGVRLAPWVPALTVLGQRAEKVLDELER